jgi:hypothetical protein
MKRGTGNESDSEDEDLNLGENGGKKGISKLKSMVKVVQKNQNSHETPENGS